jgi:leucyl-tRNA synthetase
VAERDENLMSEGNGADAPAHDGDAEAGAGAGSAGGGAESAELPFRYGPVLAAEIEARWQQRWAAAGTFHTPNPTGPLSTGFAQVREHRKFFVLDMFPYPSGTGLHVGHPLGYIATDVYARFRRMTGHNVLHTFGYDAFGLPAEQYAINTGQHPAVTTAANIANIRAQLRRLGLGHDERREVATSDPSFYRWTQWIFLQIYGSWFDEKAGKARPIGELVAEFESGARQPAGPAGRSWAGLTDPERRTVVDGYRLAYVSEELVNWCPGLGTVLANEEVTADGRSDIGNYPVYRRPLRQWMLRITAYADRLIEELDLVDWPEPVKHMQRNWIGASEGAYVDFSVAGRPDVTISVFTTRPDTLSGATYLALSPEHPLVADLTAPAWPAATPARWRTPPEGAPSAGETPAAMIRAYQDTATAVADRRPAAAAHDKTGVFTGSYVINPATSEPMPVFIADYVLMAYGTGAIMAVPAHDQRDIEFARAFGLPLRAVLQPPPPWLAERSLPAGAPADTWPEAFTDDGQYAPAAGPSLAGLGKDTAFEAAIDWLAERGIGRRTRRYRLRDWLFSRQRYWGEPFPIVYDEHGPVALPEDMLPVLLPDMTDFRPAMQDGPEAQDPVPPLARVPGWGTVTLDLGDGPKAYRRELNTMPQWAGSCWYYLRYLDPANEAAFVDPQVERYWMAPSETAASETAAGETAAGETAAGGVDLYVGGVEHAVLHLLYARFWHKVLYDLNHVSTPEPFARLLNQGYILADAFTDARGMYVPAAEVTTGDDGRPAYDGDPVTRRVGKMGKSLKNSVSPDEIFAAYGADTLRLYEMAMGPLDSDRPWRTDDISGVYRALQRLWRSVIDERSGKLTVDDAPLSAEAARRLNWTIKAVRHDFTHLRFHTAMARLHELNAYAAKVSAAEGRLPRGLAEPLVLMTAPLAPHIAEELWSRLGHEDMLTRAAFPAADESLAAARIVVMPVQVDGKTRFRVEVPAGADEAAVRAIVTADPGFAQHTGDSPMLRLVVVPGRIANIVTR